jgi:HAD superfamily hydrolase (TIGR01490 family)
VRLIVFDLDHTLLTVNSSFYFGSFLYRQGFFSLGTLLSCLIDYARSKWLGMSIADLHIRTFKRLFLGCSISNINHYVNMFLNESLKDLLYDPVVQRLENAQNQGDYVLILSSSPDFLVKEIAQRLHVPHWKATVYQTDEEGKLTAISQVMDGQDKANYIKELADRMQLPQGAITVYSDSYLDLPILKMAGQAIGVGPDYHLKRICLQNGWEIL